MVVKKEDGIIRKLSKRKDPEAKVSYYDEVGIPIDAVKLYLATIERPARRLVRIAESSGEIGVVSINGLIELNSFKTFGSVNEYVIASL